MNERVRKIVEAFDNRYETIGPFDENWQELCIAAALREVANCFDYDSYGLAWLNADDFNQIADELEELK